MSELVIRDTELPEFQGGTLQEHLEAWNKAFTYRELMNWGMGAVASSLKGHYGRDEIGEFATQVDVSPRYLYSLAKTYEVWKPIGINPRLSFTHHMQAAKAEDPKAALEVAEHEQLSTRALEKFIDTGELPDALFDSVDPEPEVTEAELEKSYPKRSLGAWETYITSFPCLNCGASNVEKHHIEAVLSRKHSGWLPRRKGLAIWAIIPLCADCHRYDKDSVHGMNEDEFLENIRSLKYVRDWLITRFLEFLTEK